MIPSTCVARSPRSPRIYFGGSKVSKKREGVFKKSDAVKWVGKMITYIQILGNRVMAAESQLGDSQYRSWWVYFFFL